LYPNYPNPFNPATTIRYNLPVTSDVRLIVYDILGRNIATLVEGQTPAGTHTVNWQADNLPSGVYFFTIKAGDLSHTKRMVLLK
jgi:hypothetical protein